MSDYRTSRADDARTVLAARMATDGYLCLRDFLPVEPLRRAYETATARLPAGARGEFPAQPRVGDFGPDSIDLAALALSVVNREDLEAVFHSAPVLDLVGGLLDDAEVFVHPLKVVRAVPPDDPSYFGPAGVHQDYPELQGSPRQLTMWVPLTEVGQDRGALPVYPAAHDRGLLSLALADTRSGWSIPAASLPEPARGRLTPGDVLIFTTTTPHGGAVNEGPGWRLSVEARFQPLSDPLCESAVTLPGSPYGWEEVYAGWRSLPYYWRGRLPELRPNDRTWASWRELEAIRAGRAGDETAVQALVLACREASDPQVRATAATVLTELGYEA